MSIYITTIIHKGLTFLSSLLPIKYLKPFIPKGTLLDSTILVISTCLIEKGVLC